MRQFIFILSTILLSGCASLQGRLPGSVYNHVELDTGWKEMVTVRFPDEAPPYEIHKQIKEKLFAGLKRKPKKYRWGELYLKVDISQGEDNLWVSYIKGEIANDYKSVSKVYVPLETTKDNGITIVKIGYPTKVIADEVIGSLFLEIGPLAEPDLLAEDVKNSVAKMSFDPINKVFSEGRSWKSEYSPGAIASNFARLRNCLGTGELSGYCAFNDVSASVKIYPYRDGSAIDATFKTGYMLNPNGESTVDAAKANIQKAISETIKIINN